MPSAAMTIEPRAFSAREMVASPAAADGAGSDGAATDGAATDGAATDGAATDGAATDGAAVAPPPLVQAARSATRATMARLMDNDRVVRDIRGVLRSVGFLVHPRLRRPARPGFAAEPRARRPGVPLRFARYHRGGTRLPFFDLPLPELRRYAPDLPEPPDLDQFWAATL